MIECQAQGSNDGLKFMNITGLNTGAVTAVDIAEDSGTVGFAYLRFEITLNVNGATTGDWAAATFDVHANLVNQ